MRSANPNPFRPMQLTLDIRKQLDQFELRTALTCRAGELTAIVGPSGAGKTTLVRLAAGLEQPDRGIITFGDEVWADTDADRFVPAHKRMVGLVFQEYPLFPHLTVRRNVGFGAADDSQVAALMHAFGIAHLADRRPASISGGERQRAAFCQALARRPRVLLLDEPFSALDAATRSFLCGLLAELKAELGIPILHVTHDLDEAERLGDAVVAVENGLITPDWLSRQAHLRPAAAPSVTPV